MNSLSALLQQKPAFRHLPAPKRRLLEEMCALMEGKDQMQCIQIFMAYRMRMENEGLQLNEKESALMKECLMEMLPPEQRSKTQWLMNMM